MNSLISVQIIKRIKWRSRKLRIRRIHTKIKSRLNLSLSSSLNRTSNNSIMSGLKRISTSIKPSIMSIKIRCVLIHSKVLYPNTRHIFCSSSRFTSRTSLSSLSRPSSLSSLSSNTSTTTNLSSNTSNISALSNPTNHRNKTRHIQRISNRIHSNLITKFLPRISRSMPSPITLKYLLTLSISFISKRIIITLSKIRPHSITKFKINTLTKLMISGSSQPRFISSSKRLIRSRKHTRNHTNTKTSKTSNNIFIYIIITKYTPIRPINRSLLKKITITSISNSIKGLISNLTTNIGTSRSRQTSTKPRDCSKHSTNSISRIRRSLSTNSLLNSLIIRSTQTKKRVLHRTNFSLIRLTNLLIILNSTILTNNTKRISISLQTSQLRFLSNHIINSLLSSKRLLTKIMLISSLYIIRTNSLIINMRQNTILTSSTRRKTITITLSVTKISTKFLISTIQRKQISPRFLRLISSSNLLITSQLVLSSTRISIKDTKRKHIMALTKSIKSVSLLPILTKKTNGLLRL